MNRLMGHNMMRKDGQSHLAERQAIFPAVSPKTVKAHWTGQFQAHADRIIDAVAPAGACVREVALPFSAEWPEVITGLTNMRFQDMNAFSQRHRQLHRRFRGRSARRCHAATAGIDAAIDDMAPVLRKKPDQSLLGVMLACGMPMESVRANIKLAISGGQNEPRDAIAGTVWALLTHPDQLGPLKNGAIPWIQAFEEFARWISPIGMSPRRIARPWTIGDVRFEPEERVFLMFGSANRDEAHFERPDQFDIRRDTSKSIPFGAVARDGRERRATHDLCAPEELPPCRGRARADRRLGIPRTAQPAGRLDELRRAGDPIWCFSRDGIPFMLPPARPI